MESQATSKYQNPLAYLKLFFRRKWLFLVPLFSGVILGIALYFVLPPQYESYTLILVEEQRTINPIMQDLAVSTTFAQRLQTIREQILGWNNIVEIVKNLKLDQKVQDQLQYEDLIKDLRKQIQVQLSAQNLIRLSYRSKDPQQTYNLVKNLTEIFISENMKSLTKETDVAVDFLKEQLEVYKRKIKEAELASMEDQLKTLLVDSTEEHPMVKELRAKVESARKEAGLEGYQAQPIEKPISNPVRETLQKELEKLMQQEATSSAQSSGSSAVDSAQSDPNTALYKLFLMDKLESSMARDLPVNQQIYNMLLQRLETAKITQRLEASKQGTRYTVIDPPRMPLKPVKPQTMWLFIGIFLGGAAGVGLVFAREFLDQSFLDIEDAKQNLDLPVLGAISKIITEEEITQEKHRKVVYMVAGLIIGTGTIVAAILYALLKK